jgi:hypothetical protein
MVFIARTISGCPPHPHFQSKNSIGTINSVRGVGPRPWARRRIDELIARLVGFEVNSRIHAPVRRSHRYLTVAETKLNYCEANDLPIGSGEIESAAWLYCATAPEAPRSVVARQYMLAVQIT